MRVLRRILFAAAVLIALMVTAYYPAMAEAPDLKSCSQCHAEAVRGFERTAHAQASVTCLACHAAENLHKKTGADPNAVFAPERCAGCHDREYREWQASAHNAPVPYTEDEILPELITDCVRCHNTAGYVRTTGSGKPFVAVKGEVADARSPGVTCVTCHDPHSGAFPAMLRAGEKSATCDNCHGGKWQNLVLNGTGGQRYADSNYDLSAQSPHNRGDRCVTCHMVRTPGVSAGGHTLRMKDERGGLNTAGCLPCHQDVRDFNIGGKQSETKALLESLAETLKARNQGELPRNQPGKCNECHRGGTEPFRNDPKGVLEQAFQNYRLFSSDRSLGVHNPAYTRQMLRDSMQHVLSGYAAAPAPSGPEGCCGHEG